MTEQRPFLFQLGRRLLRRQITIKGSEYLPKAGPFIVAANHEGFVDAPALAISLVEQIGVSPLFPTTPWIWRRLRGLLGTERTRALGVLPIDDERPGDVLAAAQAHLKRGGVIGIFPEGRRNPAPSLLRGKTGTVRLALATGAPIIPAGLKAGQGAWADLVLSILLRRPIRVSFGPALHPTLLPGQPLTKAILNELTTELMTAIGQRCGKSYQPKP
jgi:1-acyl-sn-glycerol-3-phosphate acyltransferase